MAVSGYILLNMALEHTESKDLTTPAETLPKIKFDVTSGTGASQMDQVWHYSSSAGTSGVGDVLIDLQGGGNGDVDPVDSYGSTLDFDEVRMLYVKNTDSSNILYVGGGGGGSEWLSLFATAGDYVKIRPGGVMFVYAPDTAGYAVADNNDLLMIHASAASTTYDIIIGGVSA